MDSDSSLNAELAEAGKETILDCLAVMQSHWAEYSAAVPRRKKEWSELLSDLEKLPLKFQINEIRRDISSMWDKCLKSEEERLRFAEFHSDNYSEVILEKHREVLRKLDAYYVQHRELIDLVHKYEEMWRSAVSIKERSQNPERLFNNRGAQLLQEEHERKLVSKIPQMQKIILNAIKKKKSEGVMFLIRGQQFSAIIERHNVKEERKIEKRTPMTCLANVGPSSKRSRTVENTSLNDQAAKGHYPSGHHKAVRQLEMK